jgi:hypothetical protein
METYKIVRLYFRGSSRVIKRGLTWEQVQAHRSNPETNADTCTKAVNKRRTARMGFWFDSFRPEVRS